MFFEQRRIQSFPHLVVVEADTFLFLSKLCNWKPFFKPECVCVFAKIFKQ